MDKKVKKVFSLAVAFALLLTLVCIPASTSLAEEMEMEEEVQNEAPAEGEKAEEKEAEESESAQKPVMLAVSFGTSFNDSRDITIGAVENALAKAFPEYELRRAFTSQIIIDKLKERDGLEIDNIDEAFERLIQDGVKDVVVVPTHVMMGFEYDDVAKVVEENQKNFDHLIMGKSLLAEDGDFRQLVEVLAEDTKEYQDDETAIVYMGHGTEHQSNEVYAKLQETFANAGQKNYFVGTVEATPSLEDVLQKVQEGQYKKVVLLPLMIVAGDHANNDMAGDEEDSWKSAFEKAGYEVECVIRGLGESEGVREMIIDHTHKLLKDRPVMLAVSFGTSFNDSRDITIGAVENALAKAFPEYELRRAFTSQIIIDKLKERDGLEIDNIDEAFERLIQDEIKDVVVVPTHVMMGFEYDDVAKVVEENQKNFDHLIMGKSLLAEDGDFDKLVDILVKDTEEYQDDETAIVYMGHGTEHQSNEVYAKLQETFAKAGQKNYFVGTVEATPSLEDVLQKIQEGQYKKVVLLPLMIVAGDHANNDMAGDEEDSWKSAFEKAGYEVECVIRGLGESEGIREMIIDHTRELLKVLEAEKDDEAQADGEEKEAEEPVTADQLQDGHYEINVESSSSMFRVVKCELIVENGEMKAVMTMSGKGYGKLFMGTGEEALKADESEYIPFVLDDSGAKTFTVPVEALNLPIDCAAWSIRKEKWYDRTLVFEAAMIPLDAMSK